jgi:anaerobic magnesium-protoporphyrin IX monomethyl ester cyclase
MDILLTHGYFLAEDAHERQVMKPYPTLGLLYLSAYLKSKGFAVGVWDSTFKSLDEFQQYLLAERPPVVGLYVNLMTKFNALKMMAVCRAVGARVVLGGPEPASYAAEYLARGADVIVVGEGEVTLEDLLTRQFQSLAGVPGIAYRDDDGHVVTTSPRPYLRDLDALPFPDREAIDLDRYVQVWRDHHGQGSVSLICARGCPFHCQWCSHAVYGHTHRRRSPANVADELEMLLARYQPDQVWYADDVFTIHRRWFLEYAQVLKARGLRLPFECISRPDRLDETVIAALKEMGCYRLWLGSESGSQRVLDRMRRDTRVDDVQAKTHMLQAAGIQVGMFIMLGYEGEDLSDLEATTAHLKRSNPDLFLTTVAYPIKGTGYAEQVAERTVAPAPWDQVSDRDLRVRGRYSRRFYSFATRWMVNAVALHREWRGPRRPLRLAKTLANTVVGRAGMAVTQGMKDEG